MNLVSELINSFDALNANFRPTEIYNESWLIKLVMYYSSSIKDPDFPISFHRDGTWYSEALLPTAFKPSTKGDKLGESRTNADGVIGQFQIGNQAKADFELSPNVTQFLVLEAKMFFPLSSGVTHAKYFDQAARSVACIAESLNLAGTQPSSLDQIGFFVLAPESSIARGTFSGELSISSIQSKVKKRITPYEVQLDSWYESYFSPVLKDIQIKSLSWEAVLNWITSHNSEIEDDLHHYYQKCIDFN